MAAGIFALLLEANNNLTWRDVQHLAVLTSAVEPLREEKGWMKNAAGFCFNQAFGAGLLDAKGLVTAADPRTWQQVPPQHKCQVVPGPGSGLPKRLTSGHYVEVVVETDGCRGQPNEVAYLEHVQFILTLNYSRRGAIRVDVQSPSGTRTTLMHPRDWDKSTEGFKHWPLMSTHTWGENPSGRWTLRVYDDTHENNHGEVLDLTAVFYGTQTLPDYRKKGPINKCDLPDPSAKETTSVAANASHVSEAQMTEAGEVNLWDDMVRELLQQQQAPGQGLQNDYVYPYL